MKNIFAVCDLEVDYALNFMDYLNQKKNIPFEIQAFTNVESLIGQQAIVISEINNLQGIGQVTVNGQEWSARSTDEEAAIPVGCVVIIERVSGVKLIVTPKQ